MKILIANPPQVPSYFNAGHHLPIFQVAQYLRESAGQNVVKAFDWAALNATWKEISNVIVQERFALAAVMIDYDGLGEFNRLLR